MTQLSHELMAGGIHGGLALALAAPFVLVAALHSRTQRWRQLVAVGSLVLLSFVLVRLPRVDGFRNHSWAWQETLLLIAFFCLLAVVTPGISLDTFGVTSHLRPRSLKPAILALGFAVLIPIAFLALGSRKTLDAEGWIYLSLMPGLAEELVFRGVIQSLLNQVFGRQWSFANAELGWSLLISTLLFAAANGLLQVDSQLHPHVSLVRGIAPMASGLIAGWIRERTNSIWPSAVGHNLVNLVIPLGTLLLKSLRD
jgi:membrane protease YdiL (CAAX protease family)